MTYEIKVFKDPHPDNLNHFRYLITDQWHFNDRMRNALLALNIYQFPKDWKQLKELGREPHLVCAVAMLGREWFPLGVFTYFKCRADDPSNKPWGEKANYHIIACGGKGFQNGGTLCIDAIKEDSVKDNLPIIVQALDKSSGFFKKMGFVDDSKSSVHGVYYFMTWRQK